MTTARSDHEIANDGAMSSQTLSATSSPHFSRFNHRTGESYGPRSLVNKPAARVSHRSVSRDTRSEHHELDGQVTSMPSPSAPANGDGSTDINTTSSTARPEASKMAQESNYDNAHRGEANESENSSSDIFNEEVDASQASTSAIEQAQVIMGDQATTRPFLLAAELRENGSRVHATESLVDDLTQAVNPGLLADDQYEANCANNKAWRLNADTLEHIEADDPCPDQEETPNCTKRSQQAWHSHCFTAINESIGQYSIPAAGTSLLADDEDETFSAAEDGQSEAACQDHIDDHASDSPYLDDDAKPARAWPSDETWQTISFTPINESNGPTSHSAPSSSVAPYHVSTATPRTFFESIDGRAPAESGDMSTLQEWYDSPGFINGINLDDLFTGDSKLIKDNIIFELCKRYTIPTITEMVNRGRQEGIVTQPMLSSRLATYKKKLLATGSGCEYKYEFELNHSRKSNGHASVHMPDAKLKCGKCETCQQVDDEPPMKYWTGPKAAPNPRAVPISKAATIDDSGAVQDKQRKLPWLIHSKSTIQAPPPGRPRKPVEKRKRFVEKTPLQNSSSTANTDPAQLSKSHAKENTSNANHHLKRSHPVEERPFRKPIDFHAQKDQESRVLATGAPPEKRRKTTDLTQQIYQERSRIRASAGDALTPIVIEDTPPRKTLKPKSVNTLLKSKGTNESMDPSKKGGTGDGPKTLAEIKDMGALFD